MNDPESQSDTKKPNDQTSLVFYPGKAQLVPIAFNIAISPVLLYLSRLWPWPPTILHLGVFLITTIVAIRFLKKGIGKPRIIFDDRGIHFGGKSYPTESIIGVQPYMRALRVWIDIDGKEKEKVVNLWWASKNDIRKIVDVALARYKLRD